MTKTTRAIDHYAGTLLLAFAWGGGGYLLWGKLTWFAVLCFVIAAGFVGYDVYRFVRRKKS
jgi:hypothetical protein